MLEHGDELPRIVDKPTAIYRFVSKACNQTHQPRLETYVRPDQLLLPVRPTRRRPRHLGTSVQSAHPEMTAMRSPSTHTRTHSYPTMAHPPWSVPHASQTRSVHTS